MQWDDKRREVYRRTLDGESRSTIAAALGLSVHRITQLRAETSHMRWDVEKAELRRNLPVLHAIAACGQPGVDNLG